MDRVSFVDSHVLVALLSDKTKKVGKDYVIVDVRDEDAGDKQIVGAINEPSHLLFENDNGFQRLTEFYGDIPEIYFHCAFSQQRGPKCAYRYCATLAPSSKQQVRILRGGFEEWQAKYRGRNDLIESRDPPEDAIEAVCDMQDI